MGKPRTDRRLAAIMATDVVGYSRKMAADEIGTLSALKRHRETIFDPAVARHHGRIVKLMGDGTLVEFTSVVDAVSCALAIQQATGLDERDTAADIILRIGINLGDVIIEGDDLYGDGVNVAARLESLADPGGVCIASIVKESVGSKIDVTFTDGGDVMVKTIDHPIRVWKWHPDDGADADSGTDQATSEATASRDDKQAAAGSPGNLTIPDKPSIAVLPFANLSGDVEQEYFADGISEDIITALSRISWFFVIARNTTFTYKGQTVDVRQVARELGVRYVLQGSVRRAGNRIRITGQLVEGKTGNQLWAEKYDRNIEDVFAVQDEITENIAGALEPQMALAESIRSQQKTEQNLDAWDLVIQALARIGEFSETGSSEALVLLNRAINIDPTYARAYSQKAWLIAWRIQQGWDDVETLPKAIDAVKKAVQFDPNEPLAYIARLFISTFTRDADAMMSFARRAIDLNPNYAMAHSFLGAANALTGHGDRALEWIDKARRLSPRDIFREEFDVHTSFAYFQIGEYKKSAEFAARALEPRPDHVYPHLILAACHAHLGTLDAAGDEVFKIVQIAPEYSMATAERVCVFVEDEVRGRFLDGLRKAGFSQ